MPIHLAALLVCAHAADKQASHGFSQKLDLQARVDDRSSRDLRYQYRVRYYPQYTFNDSWSVNGFAVTGDEFGSSHNTIDDGAADYFYLRRLYARHEGDYGKTEIGIVPTFKGRVSSSGLSKDGWITGIRHVRSIAGNQLEIVVGQLSSLNPSTALNTPDDLDYIEVEYSANINEKWSYELSAERITNGNFLRTELRYQHAPNAYWFGEFIQRIDDNKAKVVLGVEGEVSIKEYPIEYFAHYSYVSDEFGLRAELTEDFLGSGHGISAEFSGDIRSTKFSWFVRYDGIESRTRVLAGLKWKL